MSPNPLMFWNLFGNGKFTSLDYKYCDCGDIATPALRASVASYLQLSYINNCGNLEDVNDIIAIDDTIPKEPSNKQKRGASKTKAQLPKDSSDLPPPLNENDGREKRPRGADKPKKYGFDDYGELVSSGKKRRTNRNASTAKAVDSEIPEGQGAVEKKRRGRKPKDSTKAKTLKHKKEKPPKTSKPT